MAQTDSKCSQAELTAIIIATVTQQPRQWTSGGLASELGETQARINRVLQALEAAGWTVERSATEPRYALTFTPPAIGALDE